MKEEVGNQVASYLKILIDFIFVLYLRWLPLLCRSHCRWRGGGSCRPAEAPRPDNVKLLLSRQKGWKALIGRQEPKPGADKPPKSYSVLPSSLLSSLNKAKATLYTPDKRSKSILFPVVDPS